MVADEDGPVWQLAADALRLGTNGDGRRYQILESRGRERDAIFKMDAKAFSDTFWDARVFGNTFLEDIKGKDYKPGEKDHFISTGAVQFGPGVSIAPIDIEYQTWTNKAGVQEGKDRGMAPLAWRFVPHAVYIMPFFVNPLVARKSGCLPQDIEFMKFLIPFAYRTTASVARPDVEILHAWYGEHKSPLGSCPDYKIIDAMTPRKKSEPDQPSRSASDYEIPQDLPEDISSRLASFEDLCTKDWTASAR